MPETSENRSHLCEGAQDEIGAICKGPGVREYIALQQTGEYDQPIVTFNARWCLDCHGEATADGMEVTLVDSRSPVTFKVERNPEEADNPVGTMLAYGIWECGEADPDNDEIVATVPDLNAALEWIRAHTPPSPQYLKLRGIGIPS